MLTVKHIRASEGQEDLYLAPHGVRYSGSDGPRLLIHGPEGNGGTVLYAGIAYVMNDHGSTIGTYRLGNQPERGSSA